MSCVNKKSDSLCGVFKDGGLCAEDEFAKDCKKACGLCEGVPGTCNAFICCLLFALLKAIVPKI